MRESSKYTPTATRSNGAEASAWHASVVVRANASWLPAAAARPGQPVTIRYFGQDVPASVAAEPLFDPEMRRLRS